MMSASRTIAFLMTVSILMSSTLAFMPVPAAVPGKDTPIDTATLASFVGENDNEGAGNAASFYGDLNGDGYEDVVVASSQNSEGTAVGGQVYILWGSQKGWTKGLSLGGFNASFQGSLPGGQAGYSIDTSGDLNGDGFDDLVISAPTAGISYSNEGWVYVVFGRADAKTAWTMDMDIATEAGASFYGEGFLEQLGEQVSTAGDVNGDGYDDLLIGAPHTDTTNTDEGKAYLVMGRATGWKKGVIINESCDASFLGENLNDQLGSSVALVDDVNGDKLDDIVIGAVQNGQSANMAGKVYMFLGKRVGLKNNVSAAFSDASYLGEKTNELLGIWVAGAEDVNGDGLGDFLMTASLNSKNGNGAGQVYLVLGKTVNWTNNASATEADAGFVGESPNDNAGLPSIGAGDINKDGLGDLMIAARFNDQNGQNTGKVYVVYGKTNYTGASMDLKDSNSSFLGAQVQDAIGACLAVGDVDGDTVGDIGIGSNAVSWSTGTDQGMTYLMGYSPNEVPTAVTGVAAYADAGFANQTHFAFINDTLYLELTGTDANASTVDMASVWVNSTSSPVGFKVNLLETSNQSGTYHGSIELRSPTRKDFSWLGAALNDTVDIRAFQDHSKTWSLKIGAMELFPANDSLNATEDQEYVFHYDTTNVTGPMWTFGSEAAWLNFNLTSQNLSGIPDNSDVGTFRVMLNVSDGFGRTISKDFNITVANTLPNITTVDNETAVENQQYLVQYNSTDDGQGNVTWNMTTDTGDWLTFNTTSQVLEGVPGDADVGQFWVNISVNDGNGGLASHNFSLKVLNIKEPPSIIGTDLTIITEDQIYQNDYAVSDPDIFDTLTWTLSTNAAFLMLSPNYGVLSGLPINEDVGSYWVNVTVSDSGGLYDFRNFTLQVVNVNDAPYWVDIPDELTIMDNEPFAVKVVADDDDLGDNLKLVYSMKTAPTTTATIGAASGNINWVPEEVGPYFFNVSVTDGKALANHTIIVTVEHVNVAPAATLTGPTNGTTVTSARPTFVWTALDTEGSDILSDLYVSPTRALVVGQDAGALLSSGISGGTYTPAKDLVPGTLYYWTIVPFDGMDVGTSTNGPFQFTVSTSAPINHPPTIETIKDQTVTVKKELKLTVSASDKDAGTVLTYLLMSPPSGMNITQKGVITWTPNETQVGNYTIVVRVSDGEFTAISSFKIQVKKVTKTHDATTAPNFGLGALIALVLLILIGLVAWAMSRKSDKKPEEPQSTPVKDEEE